MDKRAAVTAGLHVRLRQPESGWSGLLLRAAAGDYEHAFAYTPEDTISLLAEAVAAVAGGARERTVALRDGSHEADLTFRREAGSSSVLVTVTEHRGFQRSRLEPGSPVFQVAVPAVHLATAFWRAFRELASAPAGRYADNWHYPFPSRAVEQLRGSHA